MAISFPVILDDFFNDLVISSMSFELGENVEIEETASGEILTSTVGARLWFGSVVVSRGKHSSREHMRARLDLLRRPGASFLVGHPFAKFPQSAPSGTGFGAITVNSRVSSRELTLVGVPAAGLTAGDHISIEFATGKFSYHRIVTGGTTGNIEVNPDLPAGVSSGNTVTAINPYLKAIIRPGNTDQSNLTPARISGEFVFDWVQTMS